MGLPSMAIVAAIAIFIFKNIRVAASLFLRRIVAKQCLRQRVRSVLLRNFFTIHKFVKVCNPLYF